MNPTSKNNWWLSDVQYRKIINDQNRKLLNKTVYKRTARWK